MVARFLRNTCLVSATSLLCACELLDDGGIPSIKSPLLFFSVGDPVAGGPEEGSFQDALDGHSYVFDVSNPDDPHYECQHDDTEMFVKAEENHVPVFDTCNPPDAPVEIEIDGDAPTVDLVLDLPDPSDYPMSMPRPFEGVPGGNALPAGESTWVGAEHGGCGTWAVAMCNRRLGVTDPTTNVDETEWNRIAEGIHMDRVDGGSNMIDRAAYYRSMGYCVVDKSFGGSTADYEEVRDNLDFCDIKIGIWRRTPDGGYTDGHVETVIGANDRAIVTNSWGHAAAIQGGDDGGFGHWIEGRRWTEEDGSLTYPPDATDVMITYVCPCVHPMMETLGQRILRSIGF